MHGYVPRQGSSIFPVTLMFLFLVLSMPMLHSNADEQRVSYVLTDKADTLFYRDGIKKQLLPPGTLMSLRNIITRSSGVIVVLDPNWETMNSYVVKASRTLLKKVLQGGVVVAGLNGMVLMNLSMSRYGLVIHLGNICPPIPVGYNSSKYLCVRRPYWSRRLDLKESRAPIYIARLGKGTLLIIPCNIVWAYADTRNSTYLLVAREAISMALEIHRSHREGYIHMVLSSILVVISAMTTAAISWMPSVNDERRRVFKTLVILRRRIRANNVVMHPLRRRILSLLDKQGYIYFNELWRQIGSSKATVSWHTYLLERHGYLRALRWKGKLFIYRNTPRAAAMLAKYLALHDRRFCHIVRAIQGACSITNIAGELGVGKNDARSLCKFISINRWEALKACGV